MRKVAALVGARASRHLTRCRKMWTIHLNWEIEYFDNATECLESLDFARRAQIAIPIAIVEELDKGGQVYKLHDITGNLFDTGHQCRLKGARVWSIS